MSSNPEELRGVDGAESHLGQFRVGAEWLLNGLELEHDHVPSLLRAVSEGKAHARPCDPSDDGGVSASRILGLAAGARCRVRHVVEGTGDLCVTVVEAC